jgi:4-carboxymuconolactone decarboxylase
MPRLAELSDCEVADSVAQLFGEIERSGGNVPPIYRVLAHSPRMVATWHKFSAPLRGPGDLTPGLRELAVLRVSHVTGSGRQWSHHSQLASAAGIADDKIEAVRADASFRSFSEVERRVLRLADRVGSGADVDQGAFMKVLEVLGEAQTVELIVVASYYRCLAGLLSAFGLT